MKPCIFWLLAEFNEKYRSEMRIIYIESETVLKIVVASIKTTMKKRGTPTASQSKIKNQKSKNDEQ